MWKLQKALKRNRASWPFGQDILLGRKLHNDDNSPELIIRVISHDAFDSEHT